MAPLRPLTRGAVTQPSPAKINLFLEVLDRRPDGYHTLWTLFQEISLCDTLTASLRKEPGIALSCNWPHLSVGPENLVSRAARLLWTPEETPGVSLTLRKKIPMGAGLGGGSGNAATALKVLWALRAHRDRKRPEAFPADRFRAASLKLGADVPFFLRGGTALGRGVGDRLTFLPRPARRPLHFVLVFPRVFSSTPEAFRRLRFPLTKRRSGLKLKQALADGAPARLWAPWLYNRLEESVFPRWPVVAQARQALEQAGCLAARMSGSGASVFGVVESPAQGRRVLERLRREPWDTWLVRSMP